MATSTPADLADEEHNGVCAVCEGSGANIACTGECGRSFHDACSGVTADDTKSKEWRCLRCVKILVVSARARSRTP